MPGNQLRHALRPLLLGAAAMLATAAAMAASPAAPRPALHTIVIDGMRFVPAELVVNAGDTVVWINKDPFPHTATSAAASTATGSSASRSSATGSSASGSSATGSSATRIDSKQIAPGRSWKFVATRRGDFAYLCTLHRTMQGKLSVK